MNWPYILKHWGGTLLFGTTILMLVSGFGFSSSSEIRDSLIWFIFYLIASAIYSVPTLIVYVLVFFILIKRNIDSKWIKLILIFVTVAGVTLTTSIIDSEMLKNLTIYYSLSTVVTGVLLKFRKLDPI
jgi:hypothetical protein